jgi:hypothetical protein
MGMTGAGGFTAAKQEKQSHRNAVRGHIEEPNAFNGNPPDAVEPPAMSSGRTRTIRARTRAVALPALNPVLFIQIFFNMDHPRVTETGITRYLIFTAFPFSQ